MKKRSQPLAFRPLMDWWVGLIIVVFLVILACGIPVILWYGGLSGPVAFIVVGGILISLIYFIDVYFYSYYILDREALVIASHLRRVVFPYRFMRELRPGGFSALVSRFQLKRFAFSRKNLIIKLQQGRWQAISVSPKDRDYFVDEILERIDHERSTRATRLSEHPQN